MGYAFGTIPVLLRSASGESTASIEQWTPTALQGHDAARKPLVFDRKNGVCISQPDPYIPAPGLLQLERSIMELEIKHAASMLSWQDEAIATAQRKKLFWQRQITSLTNKLLRLPETCPDDVPAGLTAGGDPAVPARLPDNMLDATERFVRKAGA